MCRMESKPNTFQPCPTSNVYITIHFHQVAAQDDHSLLLLAAELKVKCFIQRHLDSRCQRSEKQKSKKGVILAQTEYSEYL